MPGGRPIFLLSVDVEVDEACCDEGVDPGAGVGVEIDYEFVGFAGGRGNKDDYGDDPVEEEGGGGGIEGFVGGEEAGEWEDSFFGEFCSGVREIAISRKSRYGRWRGGMDRYLDLLSHARNSQQVHFLGC